MKIAIVVGLFPTFSETFIVNQITALLEKGHQVTIYALNKGDLNNVHNVILKYKLLNKVTYREKAPFNKYNRVLFFIKWVIINISHINWKLLLKALNFIKYGKNAITLRLFFESQFFLLNKHQFDIVHVHFGVYASSIVNLKELGFLDNSKLVISFHGFDLNPSKIAFYKKHYQKLFEQTDKITVNTLFLKNILLKVNPKLKNITILPVGLDTHFFKKKIATKHSKMPFKILFCGRLIKLKGPDLAVIIVEQLHKRGYKNINLEIIGDGELKKKIGELIVENNLEQFVFLKGKQSQEAIIRAFDNSNVFLLPGIKDPVDGRCEAQGLVIQEAQAMELPVIVSDVGGMKYGLIPNETGFVIKENDITSFADAIQNLIENPTKAKLMGEKGREFVVKNYDSQVLLKKLLTVYEKF